MVGSLPYMAPEQALGRHAEIDGRVDLFALGATLFRILSGRRIHEADSEGELLMAMASRPAPALLRLVPQLPPDVCSIIDLSLAFMRDARYPDARTMQSDVRAVRAGRRPSYALSRFSERDQKTRVEPARPESDLHGRQVTVPLRAQPPATATAQAAIPLGQTFPSAVAPEQSQSNSARGAREPAPGPAAGQELASAPAGPVSVGFGFAAHALGRTYPSGGSSPPPAEGFVNAQPVRKPIVPSPGIAVGHAPRELPGFDQTYPSESGSASVSPYVADAGGEAGARSAPQTDGLELPLSSPRRVLLITGLAFLVLAALAAAGVWLLREQSPEPSVPGLSSSKAQETGSTPGSLAQ
jgi:hypothetical protein